MIDRRSAVTRAAARPGTGERRRALGSRGAEKEAAGVAARKRRATPLMWFIIITNRWCCARKRIKCRGIVEVLTSRERCGMGWRNPCIPTVTRITILGISLLENQMIPENMNIKRNQLTLDGNSFILMFQVRNH